MKRKMLSAAALLTVSALLFLSTYLLSGDLMLNPFDRSLVFENLSFAVTDSDGNSFVIDESMRRIVKLAPDGEVTFVISGGSKETGKFF